MEKLRTNKVEDSAVEMTLPSPSGGLVFLVFFFFFDVESCDSGSQNNSEKLVTR